MNQQSTFFRLSEVRSGFAKAPSELQSYVVFSVLVTLFIPLHYLINDLHERIIPFVGWGFSLFVFVFALYFSIDVIVSARQKMVRIIQAFLLLGAFFGVVDYLMHTIWFPEVTDNPYLAYSNLRPLFTIALPLGWALILQSKNIKNWCASRAKVVHF